MAHVAAWKKQVVSELSSAMKDHAAVAVVDLHGIPSAQLQMMRQGMRPKAKIIMSRNTLMDLAVDDAAKDRPGLEKIKEFMGGQCAIVATDANPFKLFREMEATKGKAPAKAGDIAPEDIEVKAGDTPFKPGPIVGELQKVGIPAGIEGGKIVIKKDKVLVKKGEVISAELAAVLPKLEILPMTVGMDLRAVFEEGAHLQERGPGHPGGLLHGHDGPGIEPRHGTGSDGRIPDTGDHRSVVREGAARGPRVERDRGLPRRKATSISSWLRRRRTCSPSRPVRPRRTTSA